jgi:hypothetical protein
MEKITMNCIVNAMCKVALPDAVVLRIRKMLNVIPINDEDTNYKREFGSIIGPEIYRNHLNKYFVCCAFCAHLERSSCHEYCFKCSKGCYAACSYLLPGTFSFVGDSVENSGEQPWIFKTPCTEFERLTDKKYFKHFISPSQEVTVSNYEVLEGIFTGLSRGKKPCHVCAAVNMEIYKNCSDEIKQQDNNKCIKIIEEITSRYRAILGIIKYI